MSRILIFFILLVSRQCKANLLRTVHTRKKFQQNEEADGGFFCFFQQFASPKSYFGKATMNAYLQFSTSKHPAPPPQKN